MECSFPCPNCGTKLAAVLPCEITFIGCDACGHQFAAQRPDTIKKEKKKKKKNRSDSAPPPPLPPLTLALLELADDLTSQAVIAAFSKSAAFKSFSKAEMDAIMARDNEDDEKLAAGIRSAVAKGAVPSDPPVEPLTMIDVLGKSADDVALEIVTALGTAPSAGCVLVLQGLSGTGKGTTVAKLQRLLPHASAWSNGNIFRSLTLLTVTYFEKHGLQFSPETELPAALLSELMGYLHFVQVAEASAAAPAQFDVRIDGLGVRAMVSEVANTLLKEAKVSKNIPSVAKVSQGEVISFAAHCAEMMRAAGCNVLMEGRAQTLNYVRTPHRFELTLSKPLLIGMRRASQRMVAAAAPTLKAQQATPEAAPTEAEVLQALQLALDGFTAEAIS